MTDTDDVSSLLGRAASSGTVSAASIGGHLGQVVIAGAAGIDAEALVASDVTLVTVVLDASSSIASRGLEDAVIRGYDELVSALTSAREKDSLLVALWTFADEARVVHAYVPLDDATRLDATTYRGFGSTRLYDTFCDAVLANVAYAERLRSAGTPARSIVVVLTDGEDCGSTRRSSDCKKLASEVLATELFQLAFVGVGDEPTFRKVALEMGFPKGSIAVESNATAQSIRALFRMVSQSTLRHSRRTVGTTGGFFGP